MSSCVVSAKDFRENWPTGDEKFTPNAPIIKTNASSHPIKVNR